DDAPTADIYTLSLHDALPISNIGCSTSGGPAMRSTTNPGGTVKGTSTGAPGRGASAAGLVGCTGPTAAPAAMNPVTRSNAQRRRSEEHTSELQSRENLVCRLL